MLFRERDATSQITKGRVIMENFKPGDCKFYLNFTKYKIILNTSNRKLQKVMEPG